MQKNKSDLPRVFLEEECPVEELGIESQRERNASSALSPLYFLHVWWARRPLTICRAAILGSLLPAGFDRREFLELMGIQGDPIKARERIKRIHAGLEKDPGGNLYGYKRAFSNKVPERSFQLYKSTVAKLWRRESLVLLDSFAGGGSIPFEAVRMGLTVYANELNPVASLIEKATIEYPQFFGQSLAQEIERIGEKMAVEIEGELALCFPKAQGEVELDYIWVRTVTCNRCRLEAPLSPNWKISTKDQVVFMPIIPAADQGNVVKFKVCVRPKDFDPDNGTIKGGIGTCPRCGNVMEGSYIKSMAKNGKLGHQLAAILSFQIQGKKRVKIFREVTQMDLDGVAKAEAMLKEKLPEWERKGLVPNEEIPEGNKTKEPRNAGILHWHQLFNPRQLLVHLTTLEKMLDYPWGEIKDAKKREALRVYMQLVFDKIINYNSINTTWHPNRDIIASTFQRHDFSFKWSYGEIDGAGNLLRFGYSQVADAYKGLCKLIEGSTGRCDLITADAANIKSIPTGSIDVVVTDPPYYDNVMYSECSDFFYVWMKRGLGSLFPDLFRSELTDKDSETVANASRFKGNGRNASKLAALDYEAKMLMAFKEMHRVLRDDGVATIMFTHKKVEAWDTLAKALLDAGFSISASWPVHTESEHSLHQARKNAASSTILLVCRKRPEGSGTAWWEDIIPQLDALVRKRAEEFSNRGIKSLDVMLSCYATAIQIVSEHWPIRTRDGAAVEVMGALKIAKKIYEDWERESNHAKGP